MLTESEYAERGGLSCPLCASDKLSTDGFFSSRDDLKVEISVYCRACGASWEDVYVLEGYENFEEKDD